MLCSTLTSVMGQLGSSSNEEEGGRKISEVSGVHRNLEQFIPFLNAGKEGREEKGSLNFQACKRLQKAHALAQIPR